MQTYKDTLKAYLEPDERTQEALAAKVGVKQASIHRYAAGARFPDAEVARKIDEHTDGAVPFSLWQAEAMSRLGIAA